MVQLGTKDLPNVTVLPTGPYLISSATFPTYFLKDRETAAYAQCHLDIEIFCRYFVPRFSIVRRFVGTEPLSPLTNQYNEALKAFLPKRDVEVLEIPRLCSGDAPVSASRVRQSLADPAALETLLPESSLQYLKDNNLLK